VAVARSEQIFAHLGDEVVMLSVQAGSYYSLDQVGGLVWNLLQEPRKVADIRDAIFEEYEIDVAQCEQDLLTLLEELAAKRLIDLIDEPAR
jgi:hypothetical protein